jgi:hypothetical protein
MILMWFLAEQGTPWFLLPVADQDADIEVPD